LCLVRFKLILFQPKITGFSNVSFSPNFTTKPL
jgi:hypothetical protein